MSSACCQQERGNGKNEEYYNIKNRPLNGVKVLGVKLPELENQPKGALAMGHYTRVTQAVGRMDRKLGRKLRLMHEKLLALEKNVRRE